MITLQILKQYPPSERLELTFAPKIYSQSYNFNKVHWFLYMIEIETKIQPIYH